MSLIRCWMNPEVLYVFQNGRYFVFNKAGEFIEESFQIPMRQLETLARKYKERGILSDGDAPCRSKDFQLYVMRAGFSERVVLAKIKKATSNKCSTNHRHDLVGMYHVTWHYIMEQCLEQAQTEQEAETE